MMLFTFIKKHKIASIMFVVVVFGIIYTLLTSKNEEEQVVEAPIEFGEGISYNSIVPGTSTEDAVIEQLGEPLSINREGTTKALEFESSSPARNHEIILENSQTVFIKEIVSINDNLKAKDLIQKYGEPNSTLYNTIDPNASFSLYVYENQGLAYLGHEDGTLIEIWYFPPTTLEDFINQWAQGYSILKPLPRDSQSY